MCWENVHNTIPRKRESNVDARCYELKDHEKESLRQINDMVKEGYVKNPELLKEHTEYLINLISRLSGIVEMERSVGAPTAELESEIARMRRLYISLEDIGKNSV
mgnify:CR=1 FL=1